MADVLIVATERTPLDLLLWRKYRVEVPGLVETVLADNPGLAEMGIYLDVGTKVTVNSPPSPKTTAPAKPVVSLYD